MTRRVLYIVHNHPSVMPGGAETYALELYEAVRDGAQSLNPTGWEPVLLAGTGPFGTGRPSPHPGTLVEPVGGGDPNQYFFHTDAIDLDWFLSSGRNKEIYTRYFADFLRAYRPDVIHIQHSLFYGYDMLRQIRNTLPDTPIVYTLHEYLAMCFRDGQLLRQDNTPCPGPSPRSCASCFPERTPQDFFLREKFIKSQLALVDKFVSPSKFLREKYIEWGIPADKIVYEENGRSDIARVPSAERPRTRFGYFGQFTRYKGSDVLMEAMARLVEDERAEDARLTLHGANLEHAPAEFQEKFRTLLDESEGVRLHGKYRPADLPKLMADVDWVVVPSVWYENAPLVIQEAFAHGKPVICSDIGGMAEKVTDGVDGLHFRVANPGSLADVIERAATTPGLWEQLSEGIRPVHTLQEHMTTLTALYDELIDARAATATAANALVPHPRTSDVAVLDPELALHGESPAAAQPDTRDLLSQDAPKEASRAVLA